MKSRHIVFLLASLSMAATATAKDPKPSKGQKIQDKAIADVPRCTQKLGTLSIVDGDDPYAWTQNNLGPPAKLLRILVQRSGCFDLVDRGAGLNAAQLERGIGNSMGLQKKSNVGQGQIKAADYVLVAEIQGANSNVSGGGAGSAIAGALGGRTLGALVGGLSSKKMEANTVLSLSSVRTTETVAVADGYAANKDMKFLAGGLLGGGGGGGALLGGGYDNTDIGKVVTLSFIKAYTKMVNELGLVRDGDAGTVSAAPAKTFTAQSPVALRKTPAAGGAVIRTLPPGAIVYPTGSKDGLWWEVSDENDNIGWVLNTKLAPSF